jgi:nitrous oxidase accessory protein
MKFSFSILLLIILFSSLNFSGTIIVSKNGKIKSISDALSLANNGDEIIIEKGTYAEGNIVVNKSVKIRGKDFPVVDGKEDGEIFTVTANNVLIEGLVIKNSGISYLEENAGVRLEEVWNCTITNNKFINNFFAVYLAKSADCVISDNYIEGIKKRETNSGNGIHLWYCKNITIDSNKIFNHRDGIYFEFVRHGKIVNNFSKGNLRYGLHFMFSDSCEYRKIPLKKMVQGLRLCTQKMFLWKKIISNLTGVLHRTEFY